MSGLHEMVREEHLVQWARTLSEDEYNDATQATVREGTGENTGVVSGYDTLALLLSQIKENDSPRLDIGCGSGSLEADFYLDPNTDRPNTDHVRKGWMENMEIDKGSIGTLVCWGTFCFLRSSIEAFMEVNRVLRIGGHMAFDIVLSTTMPLCQTVHGPSFCKHLELHGFEIVSQIHFGWTYHRRLGLLIRKTRDWDPAHFRFPQAVGEIRNYLKDRDWYMR